MLLTFYRFINNSGVDFTMIVDIKNCLLIILESRH